MRLCVCVCVCVCVCTFQSAKTIYLFIFSYLSDFIPFCFSVADGIGVYLAMGLSSQA